MTTASARYLDGLARTWRLLNTGVPIQDLIERLELRIRLDATDAAAKLDLAVALMFLLQPEMTRMANRLQQQALAQQRVYHLQPGKRPVSLRLLVIMAAVELRDLTANTPVDCLLLDSDVALTFLYVGDDQPLPDALPEHELILIAVGESARSEPLLRKLETWPALSASSLINAPAAILGLSRDQVAAHLQGQAHLHMPCTRRVARDLLQQGARQQSLLPEPYPLIVRPRDSHGGVGLERIESAGDLARYLSHSDAQEFYLSRFIDYRSDDGRYRKYRIVLIDGQPYPCHMAVSSHWMVHYVNAGMDDSACKRAEEAEFFARFDSFVRRHGPALRAIFDAMGLDYLGIDCAEIGDTDLLVFEIDSAMVVHAQDDLQRYPYKRAPMQRLFAAFRQMLLRRLHHACIPPDQEALS